MVGQEFAGLSRDRGTSHDGADDRIQSTILQRLDTTSRQMRDSLLLMLCTSNVPNLLDPAFVPGTGTPVPGGLTMREAIPIVRRLCAENEIIGFELVELDPLLDNTYRSALNGNFIMHACLTGIAMQRKGITQSHYLSELTTEHRQPEAGQAGREQGEAEEIDPNYGNPASSETKR